MSTKKNADLVSNRKAFHDYEIIETFEAGIALKGTEVKSLRDHGGSLQEAYVRVIGNELWLIGCSIAPWRFGSIYNHKERRDRKLLVHKKEIRQLKGASQEKGYTIVPLAIYLKNGRVKVKVGTARGKTAVDKRHAIRKKEEDQRMKRMMKKFT